MATSSTVLVQPPPKHSMSVYVNVNAGTNQRVQSLGSYSGYYPSLSSASEIYTVIPSGSGWEGSATNALFINTDVPMQLSATKDDDTVITLTIRHMLFLDQALKSWTLANATATSATVFICASTPLPNSAQPFGSAVVSVNGNFADASGNITVNTGVMTIDQVAPDVDGNIDTDEQTYA